MEHTNDQIIGPFRIDGDLHFSGTVVGTLIVGGGANLHLHGTVDDLVVERLARAIVHGTVQRSLLNEGGYVEIYGSVGSVNPGDNARIIAGSMIGGIRQ